MLGLPKPRKLAFVNICSNIKGVSLSTLKDEFIAEHKSAITLI
jgi:hypothetical protein